jgi:hypothetical protein
VAVSCSSDSSALLALGLRTVAVAFRVGACAWDVGSLLYTPQDGVTKFPHWTVALAGLTEEKVSAIIEQFAIEKVRTAQDGIQSRNDEVMSLTIL